MKEDIFKVVGQDVLKHDRKGLMMGLLRCPKVEAFLSSLITCSGGLRTFQEIYGKIIIRRTLKDI